MEIAQISSPYDLIYNLAFNLFRLPDRDREH